jgi:hypothetical protein
MPLQNGSQVGLPLIFTYRDLVYGTGIVAEVRVRGRVLAVTEQDGVWMYGVSPGGLAASGATVPEAHAAFRRSFREVLFDIAEDASSFGDFAAETRRFVNEANAPVEVAWREAVEAHRASRIVLGADARDMEKLPAETPISVDVVLKTQADFTTALNELDREPALAA